MQDPVRPARRPATRTRVFSLAWDMERPAMDEVSDDAERIRAEVRLALISGVGPRTRRALIDRFGEAQRVLAAPYDALRGVAGVGAVLARRIADSAREIDEREELAVCAERGVDLLLSGRAGYPETLDHLPDAPGVIFCRGALRPEDALAVAIVGTRHPSRYGLDQAERLASGLARAGLTVVSGLARGIDAAAHRGAMRAGGRTLAVLGSGVLSIYPPEHLELADEIVGQGALLSEAPPRRQPISGAFPQRNRLISGLSLGVVVVEAAERSGALITARHALDQGREVFAVPGRVDSRTSRGCHRLLRDGAKLVEHVDDILEELGPLPAAVRRPDGGELRSPAELRLNDQERQVLDALDDNGALVDEVAVRCGLPISAVLATLCVLETRRLARRLGGGRAARV